MKVLLLTGMPGCGKSEFSAVASKMGIPVYVLGNIVREYVKIKGMEMTSENVAEIAISERKKKGMDIWAKRLIKRISPAKIILIDGIRCFEEVEIFRERFENTVILAIHSSPATRYKRMTERRRDDDSLGIDELKERDERELSWGIGKVIAMADYMLINESTLEAFRTAVKTFLLSL